MIYNDMEQDAREHLQKQKLYRRWIFVLVPLAVVVALLTVYSLIQPGITMARELDCLVEIHRHSAECYDPDGEIACGYADFVIHTHKGDCYDENGRLICPLEEISPHRHTDSCYTYERVLLCELPEAAEHQHTEACYQVREGAIPICGLEEGTGHTHTDECYTADLPADPICGETELAGHLHTESCYQQSDPVLVCTVTGHTHSASCYDVEGNLICGQEESTHTHSEACYQQEEPVLICTLPESEGHTHTEACYPASTSQLTCGQTESAGHTHSLTCYAEEDWLLTCQAGTEGHTHTDSCYETVATLACGKREAIPHTHDGSCCDAAGHLVCGMLEVKEHIHDESCFFSLPAESSPSQESSMSEQPSDEGGNEGESGSSEGSSPSGEEGNDTESFPSGEEQPENSSPPASPSSEGQPPQESSPSSEDDAESESSDVTPPENVPSGEEEDATESPPSGEEQPESSSPPESTPPEWQPPEESSPSGEEGDDTESSTSGEEQPESSSPPASTPPEDQSPEESLPSDEDGNETESNPSEEPSSEEEESNPEDSEDSELESDSEDSLPFVEQTDHSWATVEKTTGPVLSLLSETVPSGSVNLDGLFTAEVERESGSGWETAEGEVYSGDRIRVTLDYQIPANTLYGEADTIDYQLPDGIGLSADESGQVYDRQSGEAVGIYRISANSGQLVIQFANTYLQDGQALSGRLQFEGFVSAEEGQIQLGTLLLTVAAADTPETEKPVLEKTGQLIEGEGDTPILHYKVEVNPGAQDLSEGDSIVLSDQIKTPEGTGVTFLQDNLHVYVYEAESPGHQGEEITGCCTFCETETPGEMEFTLPDKTAYILTYDYSVSCGEALSAYTVANTIALKNAPETSSSTETVISVPGNSLTAENTALLSIYSADADGVYLPGVSFSVDCCTGGGWTPVDLKLVTGQEGYCELRYQPDIFYTDTLYRVTETAVSEGYLPDATPRYFVWMGPDTESSEEAFAALASAGLLDGLTIDKITFIYYGSSGMLTFTHTQQTTLLTVKKEWKGYDGTTALAPGDHSDSVTVSLYRQAGVDGEKEPYGEPVSVTAEGGWTYTWEDLPAVDAEGRTYTYTVEEIPLEGYKASYSAPETGEGGSAITITNTKSTGYTLPEAGGTGILRFLLAGGFLTGAACVIKYILWRNHRKEDEAARK